MLWPWHMLGGHSKPDLLLRCLLLWQFLFHLYLTSQYAHHLSTPRMLTLWSVEAPCAGSPFACSGNGLCVNGTCRCDDAWRGADCATVRCPGAEENCNGHGTCDDSVTPAKCRCTQHWKGDDCSTRTPTTLLSFSATLQPHPLTHHRSGAAVCPGDCSGHGRCSGDTSPPQCVCSPYWSGADCSISQLGGGGSSSSSTTPYAVAGGAVGGTRLISFFSPFGERKIIATMLT